MWKKNLPMRSHNKMVNQKKKKKPSQRKRKKRRKKKNQRLKSQSKIKKKKSKKRLKLKTRIRTLKNQSLRNKTKKTIQSQLKKIKLVKSQKKKRQPRKPMIKIRILTPWPHSQLFKLKHLMKKRRISKKETNLFYSKDFSNFWKPMKRSSTQFSQDISANSYLSWSAESKNNCSHLYLPKTQQLLRIS